MQKPKQNAKEVLDRLSKIEGHVQGIKKMVEEGRDCPDVLLQLSAVKAAVKKVSHIILGDHLEHCICDAVRSGNEKEALEKLSSAVKKLD
ncbi:metal-sensitive transcriptional regulator [Acetonema longum]|uniref:Uncharacterized protein n=1 Tax=Acetonema longum DSM 6540 TaxID=1009370 RepID=F7NGP0_9FIRM|nr:metal-sensitive transcriptional regulator [Acetonema longum]EGO64844.1 hypothetical protein ALO_06140 [Acetonema longum DSM 6540]